MTLDEKSLIDLQTGWIKWHSVGVILENEMLLICIANVENVSQHSPSGIVKVTLGERERIETTFKFWLKPSSSETLKLTKHLPVDCNKIIDMIVDEE